MANSPRDTTALAPVHVAMEDDQKQPLPIAMGANTAAAADSNDVPLPQPLPASSRLWKEFATDKLRIRKIHAEETISNFTLSEDSSGRYCLLSLQHCGELHLIDLDHPRNFVIKYRGLSQSRYVVQSDFGGAVHVSKNKRFCLSSGSQACFFPAPVMQLAPTSRGTFDILSSLSRSQRRR